jgi:adenylate cyclase 9
MRIGIHTGSVLCGVMGTKRFKFDVWSKDVTIANQIEACGTPGRVMISAATKHFLSSAYVVEAAQLHNQDPDLAGMQLFYVVGRRHRALSLGTSVKEWRRRLSTIDTVAQSPPATETERKSLKLDLSPCCFWRSKHTLADPQLPPAGSQSSTSIAEIFTMQTQLQKCTSYAALANPEVQQQSTMDHKIVELMKEQKVDFDTYFDPQLRVLTLHFRNRDWENAYKDYGRNLDDGSSGEMMETELGYRITKQSYMYDTVTLFLVFLLVMLGSLSVLYGGGAFSLWTSWLCIFLVGLISEGVIIIHVWAVYQPERFPARFASYAQFIINWYVRSFVALYMIYYPMTIVYASIGQCTGDVIENTQDLAAIQMAFFVTIVVLISSITFMEVSHFVKLIGGLLSALLACVLVMTLHLQICIDDIKIDSNSTFMYTDDTTPPTFKTDPPEQYLTNYYHRHVAPEAVILLLLILLILAVVNRMSEVTVRLSFIGRIEAAGRRRYTRQQKTQAEWLLFNIIPKRVTDELRRLGRYSQNHDCVGVVFVSISNFDEFHRLASKIQGEAPYCTLNQIITEFDVLLEKQFTNIEKIKTIGSIYMAASGLDTEQPDIAHLLELIDYVQQMFLVMRALNSQFRREEFRQFDMENFSFQLKVGFNYGPVTSGVVGSRKMLYDIWGDTVNVASRMNSTGMVGKIHMPESCLAKLLENRDIRFERHKEINIKGKGVMPTVFVSHVPQSTT